MNSFSVDVIDTSSVAKASACLHTIVVGMILGKNFIARANPNIPNTTLISFDLPFQFSPAIITKSAIKNIFYDSRYQGVKEFLDRPYVVNGNLVILCFLDSAPIDFEKDMGDYMSFKLQDQMDELKQITIVIGYANGTLTESYAPFGITQNSLPAGILSYKIYNPSMFVKAAQQGACAAAANNNTWTNPASSTGSPSTSVPSTGSIPIRNSWN